MIFRVFLRCTRVYLLPLLFFFILFFFAFFFNPTLQCSDFITLYILYIFYSCVFTRLSYFHLHISNNSLHIFVSVHFYFCFLNNSNFNEVFFSFYIYSLFIMHASFGQMLERNIPNVNFFMKTGLPVSEKDENWPRVINIYIPMGLIQVGSQMFWGSIYYGEKPKANYT